MVRLLCFIVRKSWPRPWRNWQTHAKGEAELPESSDRKQTLGKAGATRNKSQRRKGRIKDRMVPKRLALLQVRVLPVVLKGIVQVLTKTHRRVLESLKDGLILRARPYSRIYQVGRAETARVTISLPTKD